MTRILHRVLSPAILVAVLTAAACSSTSGFKADTPTDAALVPGSTFQPAGANIDNRGRGN